ncbi:MAG TPA: DUF1552 domain-containing protein [Polyangiaceae bacterium]|nr:DUF1552 domain-containing protein [Polyangiaceae bacterium]
MAKRIIDISRRQFLVGLAGTTLALPVMPSLLTRNAYGQDPTFVRKPRLFWVSTSHGGAFESSMFPGAEVLTGKGQVFADHGFRYGSAVGRVEAGRRAVSAVLSADASRFSEGLAKKMNVLHGLDVPFYIAHNTGLHLGNYARNDGNGADGKNVQKDPRPTIDQILAWSRSFYPELTGVRERAMIMSSEALSWNYSNPEASSGNVENVRGYTSSQQLFDRIFVPPSSSGPVARRPIVDRVLASYKNLRNGNRRLSAADRQRLDDHIARLAELERKLSSASALSCAAAPRPREDAEQARGNDPTSAARYGQLFNDVVVAAFTCQTSRIAALGYGSTEAFVAYGGDWHQDVAHQWQDGEKQKLLVSSYQRFFESVFLDLAAKLDVEEAPGMTYLDNSLLVWTQESGMETHGSVSIPVVTFGSAAGYFKTGQYLDYRRTESVASRYDPGAGGEQYLGLLYNQWLANVLTAMGAPRPEFERWGHRGYGVPYLTVDDWTPPYRQHYGNTSSRYFQIASDPLPNLRA